MQNELAIDTHNVAPIAQNMMLSQWRTQHVDEITDVSIAVYHHNGSWSLKELGFEDKDFANHVLVSLCAIPEQPLEEPFGFTRRIANCRKIDLIRCAKRNRVTYVNLLESDVMSNVFCTRFENVCEHVELADEIEEFRSYLDSRQMAVFELWHQGVMSRVEIAEKLGISVSTIARIAREIRKLGQQFFDRPCKSSDEWPFNA